jgi:hypothetical protein
MPPAFPAVPRNSPVSWRNAGEVDAHHLACGTVPAGASVGKWVASVGD